MSPSVAFRDPDVVLYRGDALEALRELEAGSVNVCVTSPPYWGLRDYGAYGQLGLEDTPGEYVDRLVAIFAEVRRVLADDGTLWLNLGDSYAGSGKGPSNNSPLDRPYRNLSNTVAAPNRWLSIPEGIKPKDLIGVPWRVAFALQSDGWYLRSDVIWSKPNPMPESVTDRPTKSHEYLFLLAKRERYYFDQDAVREPYHYDGRRITTVEGRDGSIQGRSGERWPGTGRNVRSVWSIPTRPYSEAHFATFPLELPRRCIAAGSRVGDVVLDPFAGAGTTLLVARNLERRSIGVELSGEYCKLIEARLAQQSLFVEQL